MKISPIKSTKSSKNIVIYSRKKLLPNKRKKKRKIINWMRLEKNLERIMMAP